MLALPAASWLAFLLVPTPASAPIVLAAFATTAARARRCRGLRVAPRACRSAYPSPALSLLTAAVLIAEQFVGAPLSILSLIGYSPLLGARYYGMGNEAAAIAFGATLVGVALAARRVARFAR